MADAATGKLLMSKGQCDQRVTPASTFKIAISLMGYDSGILHDEHTPVMPFKKGYADWSPAWRTATDPTSWMSNSVVWYAQQVTSKLGAAGFQRYVTSFDYGNQDVTGDAGADNGLTVSWISSSLKISPAEQLAFLRRVVNRELPLNAKAYDMTAHILKIETLPNGWEVHGKTGTAYPVLPDGKDDRTRAYGWFVGWATKGQRTVVFARLLQDQKEEASPAGMRVRTAFLRDLPAQLESL
jgi:beta-lactamase class D